MNYPEKLRDPRWQKKRLKVLERDNWECLCCGDKEKTLTVHHLIYSGEPWDAPDENLETLCEECHAFRESFNELAGRSKCPTRFCFAVIRFSGPVFKQLKNKKNLPICDLFSTYWSFVGKAEANGNQSLADRIAAGEA